MHIIPVIDLQHGQVVRAVRGDRQRYRPIESALCASAEPLAVARRLSAHCATDTLYVADLDALQGSAPQLALLAALLHDAPARRLWLDAGFARMGDLRAALAAFGRDAARVTPVLGSESWRSVDELALLRRSVPQPVLSLDRRHGQRLDAGGVWSAPHAWPERLIAMCLERVGADEGPDLEAIAEIRRLAPSALIVGAGGVRNDADLLAAHTAGASAWLVASALHDGRLAAAPPRGRGDLGTGVPQASALLRDTQRP